MDRFSLSDNFIQKYKKKTPRFGFNGLGKLVYMRTYSRLIEDKNTGEERKEEWWETVKRVVEGVYNMQKDHIDFYDLGWNPWKAQASAQEMYDRIFNFKFLPPGRGLWAMGSPITEEKGIYLALINCAFVSTDNIDKEPTIPFEFTMDASMLGVGVGFDTAGEGLITIQEPSKEKEFVIPDSREGWVESLKLLLAGYFEGGPRYTFDYSEIRPAGEPIRGFGGVASGPRPLVDMHEKIREILDECIGEPISARNIVDIMNLIGKTVVAGNVRRTALLALGRYDDKEYIDLKNYEKNPEREGHGWTCVSGDTLVTTNRGIYTIEELSDKNLSDYKVVVNGEEHEIGGCRKTGYKDLVKINISGSIPLKTTLDHKLLTSEGWKEAQDLEENDRLIMSDNSSVWVDKDKNYRFGYLTGHLLGDGTFTVTNTTGTDIARLQVYKKDSGYKSVMNYISDIFDFNTRSDFNGWSGPYDNLDSGNKWWFISCKEFTTELAKFGVCKGNKQITSKILQQSPSFLAGIAAGLFDTDGWVVKDKKTFSVESTNEQNMRYLHQILLRIGILSRFRKVRDSVDRVMPGGNISNVSDVYRVDISGYGAAKRFVDICSPKNTAKLNNWKNLGEPVRVAPRNYFKVKTIERIGKADVYDINVPSIGCFSANGMIVHNSNNSVFGELGMDYSDVADRVRINGEPGVFWLENARNYGRMIDGYQEGIDGDIKGVNPCGEIGLESMGICNLVETFPNHHEDIEDFKKTLKYAYLYSKTVTLASTHWVGTNRIILRSRRIGSSVSGIAQFLADRGVEELRSWLDEGYQEIKRLDDVYSDWLAVPRSIKVTTCKPSGTTSLLCGATPGIHFPDSRYYIRRMRLGKNSKLVPALEEAGYLVEPAFGSEEDTVVVEIPVFVGEGVKTLDEVSLWEQLSVAELMQTWWADNQVSCTVTFDPETEGNQIESALDYFQYKLKSISFLPRLEEGAYKQMPYEKITKEEFERRSAELTNIDFSGDLADAVPEKFCDGETCLVE